MLSEWAPRSSGPSETVLAEVAGCRPRRPGDQPVIGHGTDWAAALEDIGWDDGGVLAVGSSAAGPLARVFIGSRSSKIVRHSPVPAVVVPRGATHNLAALAETPRPHPAL